MATTPSWTGISTTRYIKDGANTYHEDTIESAKDMNANLILLSFTGTSGDRERWHRKLIPAFVEKAHAQDIRVSFYMKFTNINWKPMFHERPESKDWIMVYADGSPALYHPKMTSRYMGCLNNPGWRQHLKDMIKDAVEYHPDALFYDNCFIPSALPQSYQDGTSSSSWACYCDVCRQAFRAYTTENLGWACALPETPDWDDPIWQAFMGFRDETLVDVMKLITGYAHELSPGIVVYPNIRPPWHGGGGAKGSSTTEAAKHIDVLLFEGDNAPRLETPPEGGMPRALQSAIDWKYGSRLRDTPVWNRMHTTNESYTAGEVQLGMAEASSFGGAYHAIYQEQLPAGSEKAEGVKRYYAFLRDHPEYYTGAKPVADVAVLISAPTNWYMSDRAVRDGKLPKILEGASQTLAELHIPFNVVLDEDLDRPLNYRTLILPNVACMSDGQAASITEFVRKGGSVVATNLTSLYEELYRVRSDFALADVFGVHYGQEVEGVVKNTFGQGRSAYLPGPVDEEFWSAGLSRTLDLFRQAMTYAVRDDWQVEVDAPPTTVINVTEQSGGNATLLHLVNYETSKRVEGIDVKLRKPDDRALGGIRLHSPELGDQRFDAQEDARAVEFTVPRLDIYDLVVVEWQ